MKWLASLYAEYKRRMTETKNENALRKNWCNCFYGLVYRKLSGECEDNEEKSGISVSLSIR